MTTDLDQKGAGGLSRRSVVRGAAWSVPVVSMSATAPAFAASPCDPVVVSSFPLSGGTVGGTFGAQTWSRSFVTGSNAVDLSATSTYSGQMTQAADISGYSHFASVSNAGATGTAGLQMFQERQVQTVTDPASHAGTYTYTFSKPVTNLSFTLSDIDYYAYTQNQRNFYQYDDRVAVSSPQGTHTVVSRAGNVNQTSQGSSASPFRPNVNGNIDLTDGSGNARVNFVGPITTFSITYWNGLTNANATPRIQVTLISDMSFTYKPCG